MKKVQLFCMALVTFLFVGIGGVSAASNTMPEPINGVITLTEDVNLTSQFVVGEGSNIKNVTLDLNGFTITGPLNNYAINNNRGDLKIVDNGSTKGKIVCPSKGSSCIRLIAKSDLTGINEIHGVNIESEYIGVKVEGATTATIADTNIVAWTPVQSGGPTTINNSYLKSVTTSYASRDAALFVFTYGRLSRGEVVVNDSILEGKAAVQHGRGAGAQKEDPIVTINGGVLNVDTAKLALGPNNSGFNNTAGFTKVTGNVVAPVSALEFAESGAVITLTEYPEGDFEIPEGVTVMIDEDKELVQNEDGTYYITDKIVNPEPVTTETSNKNEVALDDVPKTGNTLPIALVLMMFITIVSGAYSLKTVKNLK